jgi:voltage-gated potassium channel
MKFLSSQITAFLQNATRARNMRLLLRFVAVLVGLVILFSVLFHVIMLYEGKYHSWLTGVYWTLTVMSTLGFGDITFTSDLGRFFSIVVLLSGMVFLLILLPFTFIEFFYAPWMQAQAEARAPRQLPATLEGHVILTNHDSISSSLIQRLDQHGYAYAVLVGDLPEALRLHDMGFKVVFGEVDRPDTYRAARAQQAAMIVATGNEMVNTNIAFTVREMAAGTPIVALANSKDAQDILYAAGSTTVLQLPDLMGEAFARRISGVDARAHVIGEFKDLLIAEATAAGTPLVGKSLAASKLRENAGVSVVGLWTRGKFQAATADTVIDGSSILLLAGSREQLTKYDELFCIYHVSQGSVIIIGGGRVGRATARALQEREVDYRIIEKQPDRILDAEKYVLGSAADIATLERAGLRESPAIVVTTHDDDTNIYLTIYCRRLCPEVQIISRATRERNVSTLHRAGADFVLSDASMGATAILNVLRPSGTLMLAEGLHVSESNIPPLLAGKALAEANVFRETGCHIVALRTADRVIVNPDPHAPLPAEGELIFIGSVEAEDRFLEKFGPFHLTHPKLNVLDVRSTPQPRG